LLDSHFGTIKSLLSKSKCQSILDLIYEDGIINKSAKNNSYICYKDPLTLELNFQWKNWKLFLPRFFNNCAGIKDWHVIIIRSENHFIEISNAVGQQSTQYRIMNSDFMVNESDSPQVIEPENLSEDRLAQLKYFEQFVDELHKPYLCQEY